VRNKKKVMEEIKAWMSRGILKTRERRGRVTLQKKRGERVRRERYGGLSQFRPLLFVFGSARANQTTGDHELYSPCLYPFFG
jgi:IS5 family transposase